MSTLHKEFKFFFYGVLTAILPSFFLFFIFLRSDYFTGKFLNSFPQYKQYPQVLRKVPEGQLLQELKKIGAYYDETKQVYEYNLTEPKLHIHNDELDVKFLLPGASLNGYRMKSSSPFIIAQPQMYIESNKDLSPIVKQYIAEETIGQFQINVDEDGYRMNSPRIKSDDKVLVIGDSVVFGYAISDSFTISSYLQSKNNNIEFVNAGVSGANTTDILKRLKHEIAKYKPKAIVYVLFQNDYSHGGVGGDYLSTIMEVNQSFIDLNLADIPKLIISHMFINHYNSNFVWQFTPLEDQFLSEQDELQSFMKEVNLGFKNYTDQFENLDFISSVNIFDSSLGHNTGTPFSYMSYFVDALHLSPWGTELFALEIYKFLQDSSVVE